MTKDLPGLKQRIESCIYLIRGSKVMLDEDLAKPYEVSTKVLVQAVKRNINRFPKDFMFQLTSEEYSDLRSQFVTSSGRTGRRYAPYAFIEQGIAMLSSVLRSNLAVLSCSSLWHNGLDERLASHHAVSDYHNRLGAASPLYPVVRRCPHYVARAY